MGQLVQWVQWHPDFLVLLLDLLDQCFLWGQVDLELQAVHSDLKVPVAQSDHSVLDYQLAQLGLLGQRVLLDHLVLVTL